MKTISIIIFFAVSIFFAQKTMAQEVPQNLIGTKSKKGKIVLNDYTKIETGKIRFGKDSVYYTDVYKKQQAFSYEQINYVRYQKGNRKLFGTMVGAISGTLGGFLGAATYKTHYTQTDSYGNTYLVYGNNATAKDIVISTSAGLVIGSAIGFGIGCLIPKWKTTIVNNDGYETRLDIKFTPVAFKGAGCSLTYTF